MQWDRKCTVYHGIIMGVSLDQYREAIGSFDKVLYIFVPTSAMSRACAALVNLSNMLIIIVFLLLLINDIEIISATQALYTWPL